MRPSPFRQKKSLGQHFLADPNIARKIVEALDPRPGDHILEIGPGNAALTEILLTRASRLTAIDVDGRAVEALRLRFPETPDRCAFIHADILDFSFSTIAGDAPLRVVGNLPYNITSPILFRLIDERQYIADAVVMMQKEVAERICARPCTKAYGILSIVLQTHATVAILFPVSRNVFHPKPQVASSVLSLRFTEERTKEIADYVLFKRIVRGTFAARRKTLANGLRQIGIESAAVPPDLQPWLLRRPEELAPEEFVTLANAIARMPAGAAGAPPRN